MKVYPTTLNAAGEWVHDVGRRVLNKLVLHCDGQFEPTENLCDADVVFAGAPTMDPYYFNRTLADDIIRRKKPIVMFNESDGWLPETDVIPFADFIRQTDNGIRCYFHREWKKGYLRPDLNFPFVTFDLAEYLGVVTEKDDWMKPVQSEREFNLRPTDVFMSQSIHVESRRAMFDKINSLQRMKWKTNDFYKHRYSFAEMMGLQGSSKITIALEGAGIKCQRHCEAGINSVMAMHGFEMEETYPWVSGVNCFKLPYKSQGGEWGRGMIDVDAAVEYLDKRIACPNGLYQVYCQGVENAARYSMPNYCRNHIAPEVLKHVS